MVRSELHAVSGGGRTVGTDGELSGELPGERRHRPSAVAQLRGVVPGHRGPKALTFLGTDDRSSPRVRIVDGALRCLARHGVAKTTVDDIARESGISRATLYRTFPGGKEAIFTAVVETEVARFFSALAVAMGEASDLEEVLVAGIVESTRWLLSHAALAYLVEFEPGIILPRLAFAGLDGVLEVASDFVAPFLGRWLEPDEAARAGEWAARIVFSYLAGRVAEGSLADPDLARHVVRTFVLPGINALGVRCPTSPADPTSLPNPSSPANPTGPAAGVAFAANGPGTTPVPPVKGGTP